MSSAPLESDSPAATSQPLPPYPPPADMDDTSPSMPQIAPIAYPPTPVVEMLPPAIPPVSNAPPPQLSSSPPPLTTQVSSPAVASPPSDTTANPVIPVPSPTLLPEPPIPSITSPPPEASAHPVIPVPSPTLLPRAPQPSATSPAPDGTANTVIPVPSPTLLPEPTMPPVTSPPPLPIRSSPPQPPLPSHSLPISPPSKPSSTSWPPPAPSPPKATPSAPRPPSSTVPTPTKPSYPPSPSSSLEPPLTPPTSMIPPPQSLPLATGDLPVSSKQLHISAGLIVACAIGGVILLVVIGLLCICCIEKRMRNRTAKEHYNKSAILAPKEYSENIQAQQSEKKCFQSGNCVITVQRKTFPLPPPPASNVDPTSTNSPGFVKALPLQGPRDFAFGLSNGTFTYDELVVATNGFSDANLLGQGGFGYVHKGLLPCGKEIAVKQLKEGSEQGEREFRAEVEMISRVHHKHLVSLVGYCISGPARLLVYEFVPNNSLELHLHGSGQPVMKWATRLKIAIGSAKGLAYLHEDCHPKVIHRDIKAANILLDHNFEAKVSDFGLAKSFSDASASSSHISTRVVGTFGYMAPEYVLSGKLTDKSDIYSYGVVLLELITGHPPIRATSSIMNESLVAWARPLLTRALEDGNFDALVDPRLGTNYNGNQMASMVACAAACVQHSSWTRPQMSQVVRALESGMSTQVLCAGIFGATSSTFYGSSRTSSSSINEYEEKMKSFNMTRSIRQDGFSECTGTTSEYGLNPSSSSNEASGRSTQQD